MRCAAPRRAVVLCFGVVLVFNNFSSISHALCLKSSRGLRRLLLTDRGSCLQTARLVRVFYGRCCINCSRALVELAGGGGDFALARRKP